MKGLTTKKAEELLREYGLNVLLEGKKKNILIKFFEQFNNFLTILLIIAAFLSFIIGEPIDGGLILLIVVLNGLFGLYQEAKAEESIQALKQMTVTKVRVIRDGKELEIDSKYVVPGDIIFIEEGVKISADGIITEQMNLELNEAVLTGESLPVPKKLNDPIFSGTIVAKGRGLFQVSQTGMQTKFGQIAHSLSVVQETETPLQKKLKQITRLIGIAGIIAAVLVFIVSYLQGTGYFPAFLLAISLAVAVVPEGLPAVMTITLAIGVKEMAGKKSIIRKLSAIEALGSITLIATDKTGTLTTNKMKVKEVYADDTVYEQGHFPRLENHPFKLILQNGVLCSTASLVYVHDHGRWDVLGDPTEGALLYLSQEVGIPPEEIRKEWKVIEEEPFDSVTKRMSVLVNQQPATKNQQPIVFSKGAPESILEISSFVQKGTVIEKLTQEHRAKIENQMRMWARKGLRVLAFSYKSGTQNPKSQILNTNQNQNSKSQINSKEKEGLEFGVSDLEFEGEVFLGMVAIHDAPRPEISEAVKRAINAGIKVVMITGDNEQTAEAIGVTAGIIGQNEDILTGSQLENYSDEELLAILPRVKIFARTTPFHKHRIVKLFQKLGEIVAVTGDGVNDAIALKQADVGVAMGLVGTDVARESADMVITDDNFASIVNAVEEGRNIIKNLKNAIQYLLSCNVSEAISLIVGLFLGINHLFYPIQLLYINLVTDGFPALALAFSPRNPHSMSLKAEKEMKLLEGKERVFILFVGVISSVLILSVYFIFASMYGKDIGRAAAFSVLTLIQSFIFVDLWLSHRSLHKNVLGLLSPLFFVAFSFPFFTQLIILKVPIIANWFKIPTVSYGQYIWFIIFSSLVFVGIKFIKKVEGIKV